MRARTEVGAKADILTRPETTEGDGTPAPARYRSVGFIIHSASLIGRRAESERLGVYRVPDNEYPHQAFNASPLPAEPFHYICLPFSSIVFIFASPYKIDILAGFGELFVHERMLINLSELTRHRGTSLCVLQ